MRAVGPRERSMEISVEYRAIGWPAALAACHAALDHAIAINRQVNVAVVDGAGMLICFLRMPLAYPQSVRIAIDKARTAAGFGFPTSRWMGVVGDNEGMKLGFATRSGLTVFGGGLPITDQGYLVGGIGVSGASESEDEQCAQAGLNALGVSALAAGKKES